MSNGKPVDHPNRQTTKVRQGTGPRTMVSVLMISLTLAAVVGIVLLAYFYFGSAPAPKAQASPRPLQQDNILQRH